MATLHPQDSLDGTGTAPPTVWSTAPTARIEVEVAGDPAGADMRLVHRRNEGTRPQTEWSCLVGTVNAILNADDPLHHRSARLLGLAALSMVDAVSPASTPVPAPATVDVARRARRLFAENASDPSFTVEEAAEQLGVSRATLARALAREGESPRSLLRAERIATAQRLLAADPWAAPESVARRSGFPSPRALREALKDQAPSASSAIAADASSSLIHSGRTTARIPAASTSAADAASSSASSHASSTPSADRAP